MVNTARDAISMQKICCQGNRRASVSQAEISPEYQGCRCRRRAQRSTLAVFVSCSLHMWMLPFVAPDIKTELYFSCLLRRHTREAHRLFLLYQFLLFLHLTLLLTSDPLISSVFTFFFLSFCHCLYIDGFSSSALSKPASSLISSVSGNLRAASSGQPEWTTPVPK